MHSFKVKNEADEKTRRNNAYATVLSDIWRYKLTRAGYINLAPSLTQVAVFGSPEVKIQAIGLPRVADSTTFRNLWGELFSMHNAIMSELENEDRKYTTKVIWDKEMGSKK